MNVFKVQHTAVLGFSDLAVHYMKIKRQVIQWNYTYFLTAFIYSSFFSTTDTSHFIHSFCLIHRVMNFVEKIGTKS